MKTTGLTWLNPMRLKMVDGETAHQVDSAPEDAYPQNQPRVSTGVYR